MSSTAEPLGFSLTGALLGGAMVPGAHGWVAVLSGPVGFLAPGGNCVCSLWAPLDTTPPFVTKELNNNIFF